MSAWPRGSEWRRWDLHVHSPASGNFNGNWESFVKDLAKSKAEVIGINDYFSVAGFKKLKEILKGEGVDFESFNHSAKEAVGKIRKKYFFPVVEGRACEIQISSESGKGKPRVNFHIIFDPNIDLNRVESFIKGLNVPDEKKEPIGERYLDSKFLLEKCVVNCEEALEKLKKAPYLADRHLIWMPYDEHGGFGNMDPNIGNLKLDYAKNSDIIGTGTKIQIAFFHNKDPDAPEKEHPKHPEGLPKKLCIKGSDYHGDWGTRPIGPLPENKDGLRYCWIKADPTFQGLRMATLEPEIRCYLGYEPPRLKWQKLNTRNIIQSINIVPNVDDQDYGWFDTKTPINPEMVAIIGHKGSGKSALTDIIAYTGNSYQTRHFSFLSRDKFQAQNGRLSKKFRSEIQWLDGSPTKKDDLNGSHDGNSPERVKYFPQKYLETLCTEYLGEHAEDFQKELRQIIFSHLPESDRLRFESLDDLLTYTLKTIRNRRSDEKGKVRNLNHEIENLQTKTSAARRNKLSERLKAKTTEMEEIKKREPKKIEEPKPDKDKKSARIRKELEEVSKEINKIEVSLEEAKVQQKSIKRKLAACKRITSALQKFENDFTQVKEELVSDLNIAGVEISDLAKLEITYAPLTTLESTLATELKELEENLDETSKASLPGKLKALNDAAQEKTKTLEGPQKAYQDYLKHHKIWLEEIKNLQGDKYKADTIENLDFRIKQIPTLEKDLEGKKKERVSAALNVHKTFREELKRAKEYYTPTMEELEKSKEIADKLGLSFDANIRIEGFKEAFLEEYIDRSRRGYFSGRVEADKKMETILADYVPTKKQDFKKFLEKISSELEGNGLSIQDQLRSGVSERELFDYIFSLDYLKVEFELRLDGKELSKLSPGERGMLLLIFFLYLDKSNIPIVVDQPEENLDSQTLYELLAPVIRKAKQNRQIIMVTHNPNVAIICDADQIIHATLDRENNNKVGYKSGAIENSELNKAAIDILEGTRPSFDNRGPKYFVHG